MLLSTAYFPPIEYFAAIASEYSFSKVYVEACETYAKQSYRNRFRYMSGDGMAFLNIPVVHEGGTHNLPIRDIRIDYSVPWVKKTEKALDSAYYSSPFFEFYRDEIFAILDEKTERLFELNSKLTAYLLRRFQIPATLVPTEEYTPIGSDALGRDLREEIHPKKENHILEELGLKKPYYQVFSDRYGFIENLSSIDLLFNEGPESCAYLVRTSSPR